MRLDKFLSDNSPYSRSQIKKLIKDKRVTVAGEVCTSGAIKCVSDTSCICIDGERIQAKQPRYILLNKPKHYICSRVDESLPSVLRLLPVDFSDVNIVGRLDADTTGLLLLTDDGQWLHRVINPNHSHGKTYLVTVDQQISELQLHPMTEGIVLRGETTPTTPAKIHCINATQFLLTIYEGKYHQVKRMCAALGFHVVALHRTAIGGITLPEGLAEGEWCHLSDQQISLF